MKQQMPEIAQQAIFTGQTHRMLTTLCSGLPTVNNRYLSPPGQTSQVSR